jgi:hypothetical protein
MGETAARQTLTHRLDPDQFSTLVDLLAAKPLPATPEAAAGTSRNPHDIGLEPWSFHDPAQKCDVVAYIDDRNQVRHVPVSRSSEVPKAWRRVWLEDRR